MGQAERHVASRGWPAGRVHTASLNGTGVAARLAHGSRLAPPASASFLIVYTRGGDLPEAEYGEPGNPGPQAEVRFATFAGRRADGSVMAG